MKRRKRRKIQKKTNIFSLSSSFSRSLNSLVTFIRALLLFREEEEEDVKEEDKEEEGEDEEEKEPQNHTSLRLEPHFLSTCIQKN